MTRWALFSHLFRRYPLPLLIIIAECLHLLALATVNYAARQMHAALPATRFAASLLLYVGVALVLAAVAQLAVRSPRQSYRELLRLHPLVAGWACVIAFRLLLTAALRPTSAHTQLVGAYVIGAITLAWILVWAWFQGRQSRTPPSAPLARRRER